MITYPETQNFFPDFTAEMRERTQDLPPYEGGPAVSYKNALNAYALNMDLALKSLTL
jgi:hypothetical protein